MSESNEKKLDATGLFCPEPVFRTKIELERMQVGEIISVSADDPDAEEDEEALAANRANNLDDDQKSMITMFGEGKFHLIPSFFRAMIFLKK